jgi:hypothetical protein
MSSQRIRVVMTRAVHIWAELDPARRAWLAGCLRRHVAGDRGDVGAHDWAANDAAVRHGCGRLLSAYQLPANVTGDPVDRHSGRCYRCG